MAEEATASRAALLVDLEETRGLLGGEVVVVIVDAAGKSLLFLLEVNDESVDGAFLGEVVGPRQVYVVAVGAGVLVTGRRADGSGSAGIGGAAGRVPGVVPEP